MTGANRAGFTAPNPTQNRPALWLHLQGPLVSPAVGKTRSLATAKKTVHRDSNGGQVIGKKEAGKRNPATSGKEQVKVPKEK